jgi:hypothetical protein
MDGEYFFCNFIALWRAQPKYVFMGVQTTAHITYFSDDGKIGHFLFKISNINCEDKEETNLLKTSKDVKAEILNIMFIIFIREKGGSKKGFSASCLCCSCSCCLYTSQKVTFRLLKGIQCNILK